MNQTPKQYQRKMSNLFIHKEMQREFSFVLIVLLIVSSFLIAVTIHYTIQHAAFGDGALQFGKVNPYEVIAQVSYQIVMRVTIILLLTLFIIAGYGVKFLHRIAGPIYRCRKSLIMLNQGKIPEHIHLRAGDFFTEVALEVNRQADLWSTELRRREELTRQIESLSNLVSSPDTKAKIEEMKNWI